MIKRKLNRVNLKAAITANTLQKKSAGRNFRDSTKRREANPHPQRRNKKANELLRRADGIGLH